MDDFDDGVRIEVFNDKQSLMMKKSDLFVDRLARVFKLIPVTIYLEEDGTKLVEFPTDGKFPAITYGKYRICGDANSSESTHEESNPSLSSSKSWGITRPWAFGAGPSSSGIRKKNIGFQPYETFWKRSIPYVSLCLDQCGRNVLVENTINNVYIKISENSLSTSAIISALATKIGCAPVELVILDVKFLEITDDKDIEYWKTPSRKLYVAQRSEFEDIVKVKARKKLSLNRKKHVYSDGTEDDSIMRLEAKISKIDDSLTNYMESTEAIKKFKEGAKRILECKICKDLPTETVLMLCCKQLLGCQACLNLCIQENKSCPLCRAEGAGCINVNGLDPLYSFFYS